MLEDLSITIERLNKFFKEEVNNFLEVTRLDSNPEITLKSVGHTILWACALDECYKKTYINYENIRNNDNKSEVVAGIRYARNRAIHQFTQLLYISEGATFPARFPIPFFEIKWKQVSELPKPDKGYQNKALEDCYVQHLENKPVRYIFEDLRDYFERIEQIYTKHLTIKST